MKKNLIPAAEKALLLAELRKCISLGKTRSGGNELYLFHHYDSKHLMLEVGRLRELTFRDAGGGTGKETDIDFFDLSDHPYTQIIVWDPVELEIAGGYRFLDCGKLAMSNATVFLSSSGLFNYSDKFLEQYLPHSIELGRSWIQPKYQCRPGNRKGLFTLDNLWEGIGAVIAASPKVKYLFGKVTIHTCFNEEAKEILLAFMQHYFPDNEKLVSPKENILLAFRPHVYKNLFHGMDHETGYRNVKMMLKDLGERIPPLVNAYMGLSRSMRTFGSTVNTDFGNVIDTGILVTIADIYEEKRKRYLGREVWNKAA
ncbi:MAG TPA: GNAT family N-acetyltransferase [Bacteroidia bacterium]|jgi:hypothetical protein